MKNQITITEDDFYKAVDLAMDEKEFKETIGKNPIISLSFKIFSASLCKILFDGEREG